MVVSMRPMGHAATKVTPLREGSANANFRAGASLFWMGYVLIDPGGALEL
jgi:hypothetical protein